MDGMAGEGDDGRNEGRNKVKDGEREGLGRGEKQEREENNEERTGIRGEEMTSAKMRRWRLNEEKRGWNHFLQIHVVDWNI